MSDDASELERLRRETEALNEQVKLLVRTEQRLYRSQRVLDEQLRQTQLLETFALDCAIHATPDRILAHAVAVLGAMFPFDWVHACERDGGTLRLLASTHVSGALEFQVTTDLVLQMESLPAVATLRLPRDIDPARIQPLWPEGMLSAYEGEESWLVHFRIGGSTVPRPTCIVAHASGRLPLGPGSSEAPIGAGQSVLQLFALHLERALENAWLTQALRQRSEELATSLDELERTQVSLAEASKLEAIGRLAGGVAHDFNNLLTVIAGHVSLMVIGTDPSDPARAHAAKIATAVEKGAAITAQLLAFGRKQMQLRVAIDLNELVSATTQMLGRLIGEHVEVQLHLEASLPAVLADRVQLDQVLLNLLVNARDALPDGGTIRVTTRAAGARDLARVENGAPIGDFVLLEVTDDGIGMDEETRKRIFEPFYSTKSPGRGTGLGLSVVYGIVRQGEGQVFVESVPGRGTTFGVLLPVAHAKQSEPVRTVSATPAASGARILLVEDEDMIRDVARHFLEQAGHRVVEAANGRDALDRFASSREPFDLLLTDVVMPGMGGLALARALRESAPGLRVLLMSGYAQELAGPEGSDARSLPFLAKPFDAAGLRHAVASALAAPLATGR